MAKKKKSAKKAAAAQAKSATKGTPRAASAKKSSAKKSSAKNASAKKATAQKTSTQQTSAQKSPAPTATAPKTPAWSDDSTTLLRVTPGFQLGTVDTRSTPGFTGSKADAEAVGALAAQALSASQELLFANSRTGDNRKVLLILQGMDTSGKGGIVRHVVGAVDPQGVSHEAFKAPTPAELRHDFLWRIRRRVPTAGMIGVFDRSHYEDVLIGRVKGLAPPAELEKRYDRINDFERELVDDGTTVIKVMLHISANEQRERLLQRLARPEKFWKYDPGDVDERMLWPSYQVAYQTALERTSTPQAPWYVVPADRKWFARLAVRQLVLKALNDMEMRWPPAHFNVPAERARLVAS